ncbi:MAG: type II secretion system protein [Verrucomicrobia bacterium]|nr:type II secretion system protein [Verrucomicrobiota bacterium]NBU10890.1 type II secretion system protein [Pseudomonadota bacterium]NDA66644.1 type II secretion system protein [Verrucomicrobiota bacterium]NDB74251.1 type II secretion system protein [Verrucomicrobiota bacterium]NDD38545.1 type II secretion system protein [Verrucomicrobiota bacterium]
MKVQGSRFKIQGGRAQIDGHASLITNHSPGFTLIECLVYISVFALVMGLAMQVFFAGRDGSDRLRRNADDLTRALHAGERWREDVRTATGAPRVIEENGQTWLAIPHGSNVTVYTHFKTGVWRQEHTNAPWAPALAQVKASRMESDTRTHVAAWRWEVELQIKDDKKRTRPLFTFLAAAAATQPEKQP